MQIVGGTWRGRVFPGGRYRTYHVLGLANDIRVTTSYVDRGILTGHPRGSTWSGEYHNKCLFPKAWAITGVPRNLLGDGHCCLRGHWPFRSEPPPRGLTPRDQPKGSGGAMEPVPGVNGSDVF